MKDLQQLLYKHKIIDIKLISGKIHKNPYLNDYDYYHIQDINTPNAPIHQLYIIDTYDHLDTYDQLYTSHKNPNYFKPTEIYILQTTHNIWQVHESTLEYIDPSLCLKQKLTDPTKILKNHNKTPQIWNPA